MWLVFFCMFSNSFCFVRVLSAVPLGSVFSAQSSRLSPKLNPHPYPSVLFWSISAGSYRCSFRFIYILNQSIYSRPTGEEHAAAAASNSISTVDKDVRSFGEGEDTTHAVDHNDPGTFPLVLTCIVLCFCLVLSCLVLSCLALWYFVLSFVLSWFVLSCFVLSCLVLSCLVLLFFVLSCLVLSCLLSCPLSCLLYRLWSCLWFCLCLWSCLWTCLWSCLILYCRLILSCLISCLALLV